MKLNAEWKWDLKFDSEWLINDWHGNDNENCMIRTCLSDIQQLLLSGTAAPQAPVQTPFEDSFMQMSLQQQQPSMINDLADLQVCDLAKQKTERFLGCHYRVTSIITIWSRSR